MSDDAPPAADPTDRTEVWTVAPFTIDVNFYSLTKTPADLAAFREALSADDALTPTFQVGDIGWPFGYGTIRHDDLPVFFQPAARLGVRDSLLADRTWGPAALVAASSEVHVYDDGIAILLTRWAAAPGALRDKGFDSTLTHATCALFAALVHPGLRDCSEVRKRLPDILRDHDEYLVAREENRIAAAPIWVARTVLAMGTAAEATDTAWIDGLPDTPTMAGSVAMYVGSGNSVFTDRTEAAVHLRQCWMRAMSLAQFHSVTLKRFQSGLLAELRTLSRGIRGRKRRKIVETISRKLDHLEFFRLQHERAVYGLQGRRRDIHAHIFATWDGDAHLRNAVGWAEFLRRKIDRYYAARRMLQGRVLKGMIAAIGGLMFFDLAVTLLGASETYKHDRVYGLLDILHGIPADRLLMGAGVLLVLLGLFAFLEDRR